MKLLILGAGAVGGYFGGRLQQAGTDVTFLVRPVRAQLLRDNGLKIVSPKGDATLQVKVVSDATEGGPYDLAILSCKAYDLDSAVDTLAPGIGADTAIVPLLNGMKHLDVLDARFGAERVLGGVARISSGLAADGTVVHMVPLAALLTGEREKGKAPRPALQDFAAAVGASGFDGGVQSDIVQDMWDKWVMLCALAALTGSLRGPVCDILETDEGSDLILEAIEECRKVARAAGHEPGAGAMDGVRTYLTTRGSKFAASILRDLENSFRVEAEHVIGDMIARARSAGIATPVLRQAYVHMQTYEQRQKREATAT
ncbi:MAG: ketopantoate reductase family protein [Alphaproteobacteria bacterium]|nr:ketopantoate reductase family protein [Alphaproteobacteria bacterium]